jgi:hypothetical protein
MDQYGVSRETTSGIGTGERKNETETIIGTYVFSFNFFCFFFISNSKIDPLPIITLNCSFVYICVAGGD